MPAQPLHPAVLPAAIKFTGSTQVQALQWARLVTAGCWLAAFVAWLRGLDNPFGLDPLRRVLTLFHITAATGCDESLLANVVPLISPTSLPHVFRALLPGTPVTPVAKAVLPTRQSSLGASLFLGHIVHCGQMVLADAPISDADVAICGLLFLAASACDVGIFHSARPFDVFKFLVATHPALSGGDQGAGALCLAMAALLYFWSGLSKLNGYFWAWVFQYQFLLASPTAHHLRSLFLDADLRPTVWSKLFGLGGAIGELAVGVALMLPSSELRWFGLVAGTAMHVFINTFGIGPYRWNIMQVYLVFASCELGHARDGASLLLPTLPVLGVLFVLYTCVAVPIIGVHCPDILGEWFGGFRSATFHFAGNERHCGYLLRRTAIDRASAAAAVAVAAAAETRRHRGIFVSSLGPAPQTTLLPLLRKRASEQGGASVSEDGEFLQLAQWLDGMDVHGALRDGAEALSHAEGTFEAGFDQEYVYMGVQWMKVWGVNLGTKDDESITSVHARYSDLVLQALGEHVVLRPGDVYLFGGNPIPLIEFFCYGCPPPTKRWDMTDIVNGERVEGRVPLPWAGLLE